MGDPKKPKKKYSTPAHPWEKERIESERAHTKTYGFKNKKEIWKFDSLLKKFKGQVKKSIVTTSEQAKKEKQQLISKLNELGLISKTTQLDDILGLNLEDLLERRLQTLLFKKGMSRSIKQARQFITHGHIIVNGKKITSPSYLVSKQEEGKISFVLTSNLNDINHPERVPTKSAEKKGVA